MDPLKHFFDICTTDTGTTLYLLPPKNQIVQFEKDPQFAMLKLEWYVFGGF